MIKYVTLFFATLVAFSCSCKKNIQKKNNEKIVEEIGLRSYGENYKLDYNSTKEFALVYNAKKVGQNNPFPTVFYSVVDVAKGEEIYKDVIPGGKIKWIGDYVIEVKSLTKRPKDILNSTSNILYKLNVKTLSKN